MYLVIALISLIKKWCFMKNRFSLYFLGILVSFSLMTRAMEENKDEFVIKELQRIAEMAFPCPVYKYDNHREDEIKYSNASKAVQDSSIFNLPVELFPCLVFPHLDSRTLLRLGATCHFFNELSQLSFLYLNEYCLTERMPHVIPVNTLRFKTRNTKGGLLKLAALASVSAENLCEWFDPPYLGSIFLSCQGSLPGQLEGQSEEELGALYPILKVALAAIQAEVTTPEQTGHVMQLIREYTSPYNDGMSLNKLRLLSLNPDRPGVYYDTLQQLFWRQHANHYHPYQSTDISVVQAKKVIARELLMNGRIVPIVNNSLFVHSPKKDVAIEIMELCLQYPHLLFPRDSSILIRDSLSLGRPDLALRALSWVIGLPEGDDNIWHAKLNALALYKDLKVENKEIQSYLKKFASSLYPFPWVGDYHSKAQTVSLLIQAERREDVQAAMSDMLTQPEEGTLQMIGGSLVKNLVKHDYLEEANNLILYALNVEHDKFISAFPYILDDFFDHAAKVDREKTVGLLKAHLESQMMLHQSTKIEILSLLAKFAATEEEKDYVTSHVQSLSEEEMGDDEGNLCAIYYYLHNKELCRFYYQKMGRKILNGNDSAKNQDYLQRVQRAGLNVESLEEMMDMDPFEVLGLLLKKNQ